jgi:hypothetical protein
MKLIYEIDHETAIIRQKQVCERVTP